MVSKDNNDKQLMYSKSNNIKIMTGNETDENINEVFESLTTIYQLGLEQ